MTAALLRFRSLGLPFSIGATDPVLYEHFSMLFGALQTTEPPSLHVSVDERDERFLVRVDDDAVLSTDRPAHAFAHAMWEINRRAIEASRETLLLHAAAARRDAGAVVLCGASGSGKSTLVAGLVAAGFDYLTDDAVAIDADDARVSPYPKPIGLGRDVLALFPAAPPSTAALGRYLGDEWFVAPSALGGVCRDAVQPRLVIFPTFAGSAGCEATRLSRAETLVLLAENAFNFSELGAGAVQTLAAMLRTCACYRVSYSRLEDAVQFVGNALGRASSETNVA